MLSLHGRRTEFRNKQQKDKKASYRPLLINAELSLCTDEEKLELLKRVRKKDPIAIEKMILCHIRLAISIVNRYTSSGLNYLAEDLDSAAIEGVVTSVNHISTGRMADHNNVTGYIVKNVHYFIIRAIQHEAAIYVPRKHPNKTVGLLPDVSPAKDSQLSIQELEIWDLVNSLTDDNLEKGILKLRSEGYTDAEVGELVGLNRLQILRIRRDLLRRYKRKEKNG